MPESTEVARRSASQLADVAAMSDAELERMYRVAKALALSKRFPDARTADEAFAKVLLGRDLGLSPTQAMTGIYIVEGKPQIAATTLAGFVRKSERYDYSVDELTDEKCSVTFYRDDAGGEGDLGTSTFTIDEAKRAGLVKDKGGWVKYPRNMLFARAMSNGVKWFCPDLMGGVPIYTEGDVFEGTAAEISSGSGDGSEPGWGDTSVESATAVEAIIDRAKALGHAGLSDRATAQMSLSGQPESIITMWCERAGRELDEFEAGRARADRVARGLETPDGDVVALTAEEAAREAPAVETVADAPGWEEDDPREALGQLLDRIAAEEEAGADEAVMAPLYAEQERLEQALGDEPGEEQTEIPL
jgi:hypothetical protein